MASDPPTTEQARTFAAMSLETSRRGREVICQLADQLDAANAELITLREQARRGEVLRAWILEHCTPCRDGSWPAFHSVRGGLHAQWRNDDNSLSTFLNPSQALDLMLARGHIKET